MDKRHAELLDREAADVVLAELCDILDLFQKRHGLNGVGAEELLASDSTPDEHKPFLTAFMVIWEEFA